MSPSLFALSILLPLAAIGAGLAGRALWARLPPELLARYLGLVEPRRTDRRAVVFFAPSHGEVLLLDRLLPMFQAEHPEAELIVVVPRISVEQVARQRLTNFRVECLCPVLPWGMSVALRRLAPDMLVVVEFARIPLWVWAARRLGIPLAILNGRLSEKNQRRCATWPWVFRPMLRAFDQVLVQTQDDAQQFAQHGARPQATEVIGPLKYDAAAYSRNTFATRRLARLANIGGDDVVLLAGSTREGEEAIVADIFQRLAEEYPRLRLIIVPRNGRRFDEVAALLAERGIPFVRRTELEGTGVRGKKSAVSGRRTADSRQAGAPRVLLVDTVGELAAWWGTAHIGFVGASLTSRGGQNMIEPAALGVATCFGPHTANFPDVVSLLLAEDAAVEVAGEADLENFVRRCLDDPAYAADLGRRAQEVCRQQTGAMPRTCQRLGAVLAEAAAPASLKFPTAAEQAPVRRRAA